MSVWIGHIMYITTQLSCYKVNKVYYEFEFVVGECNHFYFFSYQSCTWVMKIERSCMSLRRNV